MTEDILLCSCGKKKYKWQDMCWSCEEKKEVKDIWSYAEQNKEVTREKYVICPYCGSHYGEDDLRDSMTLTCDECGKKFKMEREYYVKYSTYQIKNLNEEELGLKK